ncbi:uncharacterized protein PAC_17674 [Phialocephala subalpina]|uniref:Uncharacterized protein n=1 Tax=Phialocephala subalpina TaxID=576137 RepID=A0A1L7XRZ9_9HELO|nr:uncharacterized protein PAC_17674 [Phialocephala subalpina]
MPKQWDFQLVWPKDGPKGRGKRSFTKGLRDIVGGKGPDMFLQRRGDGTAITPERWGNWDSYHNAEMHVSEKSKPNRLLTNSRGSKRYDPQTRTYKHWAWPEDWNGLGSEFVGLGPNGVGYPRLTQRELRYMQRQLSRGRPIEPQKLDNWNQNGPKRFDRKHDWFWQEAHIGGTTRPNAHVDDFGRFLGLGPNNNLMMHRELPFNMNTWNV